MAPTFLIVGATGNTGRSVVETLSQLIQTSSSFSNHRILALTRSPKGEVAQKLSKFPNVEIMEYAWSEITAPWLRSHNVVRAFIAAHTQLSAFIEESTFHLAALTAGVEYVVRISTTAPTVRPDSKAYYPRSHWAIETMLATEQFQNLKWSSLQPNGFTTHYLGPSVEWVKQYRKTGSQDVLRLMASSDAKVGIIDPDDIGIFAAHLLVEQDVSKHNKAKYVLNGPEDITGDQIVKLVEEYAGTKVENVKFKDVSFIEHMAAAAPEAKNIFLSITNAPEVVWDGLCSISTTSKEVFEIAAPRVTPREAFKKILGE